MKVWCILYIPFILEPRQKTFSWILISDSLHWHHAQRWQSDLNLTGKPKDFSLLLLFMSSIIVLLAYIKHLLIFHNILNKTEESERAQRLRSSLMVFAMFFFLAEEGKRRWCLGKQSLNTKETFRWDVNFNTFQTWHIQSLWVSYLCNTWRTELF